MASPIAKMYATLGLDTRGFDQGIKQTQTKTQAFTSGFKDAAKAGLGLGVGIGAGAMAFGAVTAAIGGTIQILGDAISMAAEEEAAMEQLSKAIKENDDAWDGNIDAVEERIRAGERLAFEDNAQREALRLLIGYTHDLEQAERVLGVAMDFARFRGIELRAASDVLGKAMAGNTSLLSRYGIVVRKGATATEVLAQVQKMAAGQAEAYASTTAGKFIRAQLAMDNAMEDLGAAILPVAADLAELAATTIPQLMDALYDALKPLRDFLGALDDIKQSYDDLRNTLKETPLGDVENHAANLARIGATGGLILIPDTLGKVGLGLDNVSDGFDELTGRTQAFSDSYDPLSSILVRDAAKLQTIGPGFAHAMETINGTISGSIDDEMDRARKAVLIGFREIRAALERAPRFISDEDRERNMQRRVGQLRERANAARRAGDSRSQRFYEQALASQELRLARFTNAQRDEFVESADVQGREARRGANKAISEAQRIRRQINAIDMVKVGRSLMAELAAGITQGTEQAVAAASLAATAIQRAFTPVSGGALAGGAIQSNGITIAGNVYGGAAGLRQLQGDIDNATRPTRRHRD